MRRRRSSSRGASSLSPFWCVVSSCALLGCGEGRAADRAHFLLTDSIAGARIECEREWELPRGSRVEWIRDGLARLSLPLPVEQSDELRESSIRVLSWTLPLPVAASVLGLQARADVEGIETEPCYAGPFSAEDLLDRFWIGGDTLLIGVASDAQLPAEIRLSYCVHAARLAGSSLLEEGAIERAVRVERIRDRLHVESLAVAAGSTLVLPLPPLPAGRFTTRLSADGIDEGDEVVVSLLLDGERLAAETLAHKDPPRPVRLELGARARPGRFAISVRGAPRALVFAETPLFARGPARGDPPSVLLIVVDTLRADRLGAIGSDAGLTPELDRLAEESLLFTECWSTSSWTLPSMASLLTSSHGAEHGAWLPDKRLGTGLDTLPELFRRHGYLTAAFTGGGYVSREFGLHRGFARFDASGGGVLAVVERAREWIAETDHRPWFALVHTYEVHSPYDPPEADRRAVLASHPGVLRDHPPRPERFLAALADDPTDLAAVAGVLEALYDREVAHTDDVLGRLVEELRATGVLDELVLVVTSDHGEEFGEHGLLGHADTLYVEQLHVPLILRLPRAERTGVVRAPVSQIDLAPTIAAAAGFEEGLAGTTFRGRSLLGGAPPSPVYATRKHERHGLLDAYRRGDRVLIEGAYVYDRGSSGVELFDLARDPAQKHDLAEGDADGASRLREAAVRLREEHGRQLTTDDATPPWPELLRELEKLGYGGD